MFEDDYKENNSYSDENIHDDIHDDVHDEYDSHEEDSTYRLTREDLQDAVLETEKHGDVSSHGDAAESESYGRDTYRNEACRSDTHGNGTYRDDTYRSGAYREPKSRGNTYAYYEDRSHNNDDPRYAQPQRRNHQNKKGSGFGLKVVKAACLGLVFGLCASLVMVGVNRAAGIGVSQVETTDTASNVQIVQTSSTNVSTTDAADVSDIVANVMPSIVAVNTTIESITTDWFGHQYKSENAGAGSGVIFSEDSGKLYILTNNHVIEDATTVSVQFVDDTSASAVVIGRDASNDVAVLTVETSDMDQATINNIAVAVMGDSSELKAGESAIAIGNALGYGQSVTTGVISAVEREVSMTDGTMKVIQTSAAINPGNSGGALLNGRGEVIGINYMKYSTTDVEGMGFAIPINDVIEIASSIIDGSYVEKNNDNTAYLGITGGTLTEEIANQYDAPAGVYVSNVATGSAAQRAGLEAGCIITSFNGTELTTMEELQAAIAECEPGDEVTLTAYFPQRDNTYAAYELTTIMGARSEAETQ